MTITITATVTGAAGSNRATIAYDGDGNATNESTRVTDDSSVGGSTDATVFVVTSPTTFAAPTKTASKSDAGAGRRWQRLPRCRRSPRSPCNS